MESVLRVMKNFFLGLNLKLWWEKGVFKDIFLFLVFNIILLTIDVILDIKTCIQFFLSGNILWAMLNFYMIFNPFILRFFSNFVIKLTTEKRRSSKMKIMSFSCKIWETIEKSYSCLPLFQTIKNIKSWQEMKTQKIYLTRAKAIFGIQCESIVNSIFEAFGEGAPCQILNLYIFLATGYMSETQIISVVVGAVSLSLTSIKIFFLYRSEDEVEVEPGWRLILLTIFPMMINTVASILLWTFIAAHTGGYVVFVVLVVFVLNWASIQLATLSYKKEIIQGSETFENEVSDIDGGDREEEVFNFTFTNLEVAMISTLLPCVVGKTRGIYVSQLLCTNISKLVILSCIWYLQWYIPTEHWFLNTSLVTCIDQMNDTEYLLCTERKINATNSNPCICGSLQNCFCGYSCSESQRGEKIR